MEGTAVMKSFLAGAIAGGVVMWFWGDEIRAMVDDATSGMRSKTADRLQGVAETLHSVADTVDQGLSGATSQPRVS
jgi:hypothetical protein